MTSSVRSWANGWSENGDGNIGRENYPGTYALARGTSHGQQCARNYLVCHAFRGPNHANAVLVAVGDCRLSRGQGAGHAAYARPRIADFCRGVGFDRGAVGGGGASG